MLLELDVSAIVPSFSSANRQPLRSTGSLGSVPRLRRYYELLGLLAIRRASLRFLRSALPPSAETTRPPRFLENPRVHAALCDPGGPTSTGHSGAALLVGSSVLPSAISKAWAPALVHFGAQSRGLHARCLRFAERVAHSPRKTRYRRGGPPSPDGTSTRWVPA